MSNSFIFTFYVIPTLVVGLLLFSVTRGNYKSLKRGDCVEVIDGFYKGDIGRVHWMGTVSSGNGYAIQVNYNSMYIADVEKIDDSKCN